jgi:hypothetical protein
MTDHDDRELWRIGQISCVMVSCCSGAELQLRRRAEAAEADEIVLRELYPTKADLYERSTMLKSEYERDTGVTFRVTERTEAPIVNGATEQRRKTE